MAKRGRSSLEHQVVSASKRFPLSAALKSQTAPIHEKGLMDDVMRRKLCSDAILTKMAR